MNTTLFGSAATFDSNVNTYDSSMWVTIGEFSVRLELSFDIRAQTVGSLKMKQPSGWSLTVALTMITFLETQLVASVPNAAQNLTLSSRTVNSLTVAWEAPAEGELTGYRATLQGGGTSRTESVDKSTTTFEFTGLKAGTEYTVGVITEAGDQRGRTLTSKFHTKLFAHSGTFTIVNQAYRESLADRSSDDYKQLSAKIVAQLILVYNDTNSGVDIVAVRDITFSKGSVKVDFKIDLKSETTSEILKNQMRNYVDEHGGFARGLKIRSSSITYDAHQTPPTNGLPPELLIAMPICFCFAVIVFLLLLVVLMKRLARRRAEIARRRGTKHSSNDNIRTWFDPGNELDRNGYLWPSQQFSSREGTPTSNRELGVYNIERGNRPMAHQDDRRVRSEWFGQGRRFIPWRY
ncbi:hypothetical protein LSAT2_004201 [Lamellibrachia satsuma]|nr:hypothetical protein LSAT2_004201 [Lamellibrachia satsuma]